MTFACAFLYGKSDFEISDCMAFLANNLYIHLWVQPTLKQNSFSKPYSPSPDDLDITRSYTLHYILYYAVVLKTLALHYHYIKDNIIHCIVH